jgi:hypothetical protein
MLNTIKTIYRKHPIVMVVWLLNLVAIPIFSYYGRFFQRSLTQSIGRTGIAWLLGCSVVALVILASVMLFQAAGIKGLIHLLWILTVSGGIVFYLRSNPERWYHIVLFGMLGFLSARLFSLRTGAEIALAMSVLDETFQHYLPDRVGDFEDVIINTVCSVMGLLVYVVLRFRAEAQCLSEIKD